MVSSSWEELNATFKPDAEVEKEKRRLEQAYAELFSSETGQLIFEDLRNRTIEQPTTPQQAVDGAAFNALMALREGENNLYRYIKSMVRRGQTPS
jgi:hypothetical protein